MLFTSSEEGDIQQLNSKKTEVDQLINTWIGGYLTGEYKKQNLMCNV